ncbi:MAG: hypothetical protein QJR13_08845, partial [Bacillota bacterium]|nr:hypothetical protein [Bacillota bacterium]
MRCGEVLRKGAAGGGAKRGRGDGPGRAAARGGDKGWRCGWFALLLGVLALLPLLLGGCWSRKEIDHLALAMVVGVDKAPDGRYLVELKVVKPGLVAGASAGGGQGGGGGGQTGQPFWVVTSEGKSILEALHRMRSFTPRLPFLAHNQMIVIGEEVAREGVGPVLDFFLRNRETRRTTPFFVARGLAYQSLAYASPLEPSPGMNLAGIVEWEQGNIQAWLEELGDFAAALHNPWSEPVTGVVHFETHR